MGSSVMMYVIPMMLGVTYDLGKDQTGIQIFPKSAIQNAVQIEKHYTDTQYLLVENVEDVRNFLDIDGRMSLKIKAGLLNVGGEGKYLKDSASKTNGLEILIKVHFETVTRSLPTWHAPQPDWLTRDQRVLGTHYVRSLTYGGDLVASVRIGASSKEDLQKIRGAFQGGVHTKGGGFGLDLKGKLDMLTQEGNSHSSVEIEYFATVPLPGVSITVDGLMDLVDKFPGHVKEVNGGLGNPIKMELYPLHALDQSYVPYFENRALADELEDLEIHFDDLRETKKQFAIWVASLPPDIPTSIMSKIQIFSKKIEDVYKIYVTTIAELDVSREASMEPIKAAFEAYKDGDYMLPNKYRRKLNSLKKSIYREMPELKPNAGGANYIHWGKSDCGPGNEITMAGTIVGSAEDPNGGSSDYVCSPGIPEKVDPHDYFGDHLDESSNHLLLSTVRYKGSLKRFNSMSDKNIACAFCRSTQRSSATILSANTTCPDSWTKEYAGYLMAPAEDNRKGQYICVDREMQEPDGEVQVIHHKNSEITEVTAKCGSLPCGPYEASHPLQCVVCTI